MDWRLVTPSKSGHSTNVNEDRNLDLDLTGPLNYTCAQNVCAFIQMHRINSGEVQATPQDWF